MALTKKQKQTIREIFKYLSVAEMAIRFGVEEKEIYSYLREIKVKPLVTTGNIDMNERRKVLGKIDKPLESKGGIEDRSLSFFGIIKNNWRFLVLLSVGIFLIYFNSLGGNFVSDDYATISQNPLVDQLSVMFSTLPSWSNYFLANLFGTASPIPFHLFNLIVYIVVCIVGFVFLRLMFSDYISKIAIILFATHPIHVESVSWISGKPYILVSLFVLSSLVCLILWLKNKNKKYLLFLGLCLALTFYSDKVRSTSFILITLTLFATFVDQLKINKKILFRIFIGGIIGLGFLLLIIWPYIIERVNGVNSGYNFNESIFYNPSYQYPTSIAKYLQLLLVPVDLTLYHTMYVIPTWLNWLILLSYLSCVIYFFFKDKRLSFALMFIFIASAPSMAPVKVSWLVAERYIFLGSLGFCLFLAIILENIRKKYLYISITIFVCLCSFYSTRTFLRNIDWQTNHNLWVNTVQVSPNSHNAWNNIGDDYDKLGQLENAVKGFTQSTEVKDNYADAYHNRANIYYKAGRYDLARDSYEIALKYAPGLYQTIISLTQIDISEKKFDLAIAHAKKLVEIQPKNPQSYYVLGVVYFQSGMNEEAQLVLNKTLNISPNYKAAEELLTVIKQQSNGLKGTNN